MGGIIASELGKKVWSIFRFLILVGLGFILTYPVLYMFTIAFRPLEQIHDPSIIWIPRSLTLENLNITLDAMKYWESLKNTVAIVIGGSFLQVASCAIIGYGFARFKFRERGLMFALVILTILVPPQTILIPLYLNYQNFSIPILGPILQAFGKTLPGVNILDNFLVFYLPAAFGMGIRSGLYIFVFRQFFRGLPVEIEEAAVIDGCGTFKTFTSVMSPNAGGAFLVVFLFSVVWYWNDYFNTVMFIDSKQTLSIALSSLRTVLGISGVINAYDPFMVTAKLQTGMILVMLPVLLMYIFLQKYFVQSIERTGIVG